MPDPILDAIIRAIPSPDYAEAHGIQQWLERYNENIILLNDPKVTNVASIVPQTANKLKSSFPSLTDAELARATIDTITNEKPPAWIADVVAEDMVKEGAQQAIDDIEKAVKDVASAIADVIPDLPKNPFEWFMKNWWKIILLIAVVGIVFLVVIYFLIIQPNMEAMQAFMIMAVT